MIFEIEDSSPGIPNDLIESIFEPLCTTKMEGTGLVSVKAIIEAHKGIISPPTIFTITLPQTIS